MRQNYENEPPFMNLNPLSRNPGSAPGIQWQKQGVLIHSNPLSGSNYFVCMGKLKLYGEVEVEENSIKVNKSHPALKI